MTDQPTRCLSATSDSNLPHFPVNVSTSRSQVSSVNDCTAIESLRSRKVWGLKKSLVVAFLGQIDTLVECRLVRMKSPFVVEPLARIVH